MTSRSSVPVTEVHNDRGQLSSTKSKLLNTIGSSEMEPSRYPSRFPTVPDESERTTVPAASHVSTDEIANDSETSMVGPDDTSGEVTLRVGEGHIPLHTAAGLDETLPMNVQSAVTDSDATDTASVYDLNQGHERDIAADTPKTNQTPVLSLAPNVKSSFEGKPTTSHRSFAQSQSALQNVGRSQQFHSGGSPLHDTHSYGSDSEALGSDVEPEVEPAEPIRKPEKSDKSKKIKVIDSVTGQVVEGHVLSENPRASDNKGTTTSALGARPRTAATHAKTYASSRSSAVSSMQERDTRKRAQLTFRTPAAPATQYARSSAPRFADVPQTETTIAAQSLVMMSRRTSPPHSVSRGLLTQPAVSLHEYRQVEQTSPHSSIQEWLDSVPRDARLASSRVPSRQPSAVTSAYSELQAAMPLGAEAAIAQPQRSRVSQGSRVTQLTRRSARSVPVEVLDNFLQLTTQQRSDAMQREAMAMQREAMAMQREDSLRNDALQREQLYREECSRREKLTAQMNAEREKLFVASSDKERDRNAELAREERKSAREDRERERQLALAEAEKQINLMKELAEEKRRNAILEQECEIARIKRENSEKLQKEREAVRAAQAEKVATMRALEIKATLGDNVTPTKAQTDRQTTLVGPSSVVPLTVPSLTVSPDIPLPMATPVGPSTVALSSVLSTAVAPSVPVLRSSGNKEVSPADLVAIGLPPNVTGTGVYACVNLPPVPTAALGQLNLSTATKTVPTVVPLSVTPSTVPATSVVALDLTKTLANATTPLITPETTVSTSVAPNASQSPIPQTVGLAVTATAPVVVVKQQEQCKPYTGNQNPKDFKAYFDRICLVNGWVSNDEKFQHLALALEGAALEPLKDVADATDKYDQIWTALERRFGYMNEPERAAQRFDDRRQMEGETIAVYEQALRTIHREAWPNADQVTKDGALKRRFISGLNNPEMQSFLRLHAKGDDFTQTVARARQYQDAHEQTKLATTKKPNIRMASYNSESQSQIQPVLEGLQRVLETVLHGQGRQAEVHCIRGSSDPQESTGGNGRQRRNSQASSTQSRDGSEASQSSGNRPRAVHFEDQTGSGRGRSTAQSTTNYPQRSGSNSQPPNNRGNWSSGRGNWNQPRGNWGSGNWNPGRPPWQGGPRYLPPSSGDRFGDRERAPDRRWQNNQWPTDRSTFPWGSRQRSGSVDSNQSVLRDSGQQPRQWGSGAPVSRPPPGASDNAPRGQENRPPSQLSDQPPRRGCIICGRAGCHSDFHRVGPDSVPPPPGRCWVCGRIGCHSTNHPRNPAPQRATSSGTQTAPGPDRQSNWQRGSNQGDRAPQSYQATRPPNRQ